MNNTYTEIFKKQEQARNKRRKLFYWIVVPFLVLAVIGGALKEEKQGKEVNTVANSYEEIDGANASIISQEFVEKALKSPSSADFPFSDFSFSEDKVKNNYMIKSYVDSQNSFGATVRTNYIIMMHYKGGESSDTKNWQVISLHME